MSIIAAFRNSHLMKMILKSDKVNKSVSEDVSPHVIEIRNLIIDKSLAELDDVLSWFGYIPMNQTRRDNFISELKVLLSRKVKNKTNIGTNLVAFVHCNSSLSGQDKHNYEIHVESIKFQYSIVTNLDIVTVYIKVISNGGE